MDIDVPRGKYVVAVSGGVDSVVLLDLLSKLQGPKLVVAHFNHGIRGDSGVDEKMAKRTAEKYGLPFVVGRGNLGAGTSEEKARDARYAFLRSVKKQYKADGIITSHHQDDLIETAIINMLRGTGRRGVTAIADNPEIIRPLLGVPKEGILAYASAHHLRWVEDPTNKDDKYLRNYVRHRVIAGLSASQRSELLREIDRMSVVNRLINQEIAELSQSIAVGDRLQRKNFIQLPSEIADEIMVHFLRSNAIGGFDKKTVQRLSASVKTSKSGSKIDVSKGWILSLTAEEALLTTAVSP